MFFLTGRCSHREKADAMRACTLCKPDSRDASQYYFGHMSVNLVQIGVTLHSELEGCHSINRTKLQLDLKEKVFDVEKCVN